MIKKSLISYFVKKGILLTKSTERKKITDLIESLYPFHIQNDLIRLGPNEDGGYFTKKQISRKHDNCHFNLGFEL